MVSNLTKFTGISTLICLCSFLVIRVLDIAILSAFLRITHINHHFTLFHINYLPGGQGNWGEGMIILIYTLPYLFFAVCGIFLPHLLRRKDNIYLQLSVTWLAFQMVLLVLAGLLSGIFEFQGIGVAMEWLFVNMPVKIFGSLVLMIIIYFSARRFAWYFLRKVPDRTFHDDFDNRKTWMNRVVFYPFLISFVFILPLMDKFTWANFVSSLITGLIFIGVIYRGIPLVYIPLNSFVEHLEN